MIARRHFAQLLVAAPVVAVGCSVQPGPKTAARGGDGFTYQAGIAAGGKLTAPKGRPVRVAFAISPGVQVIDVAGPWEAYNDTYLSPDAEGPAFQTYTVSETRQPVRGSGGLTFVPDHTVADAPQPDVIVVPHFDVPTPFGPETSALHRWIVEAHKHTALTMSVCTGAFQLAKTGLLDGIPVTTNRLASDNFHKTFPEIDLKRGPRFVEAGRIATSGGLSAGIDLALRTISRYFGDAVAQDTASRMEYAGTGWRA